LCTHINLYLISAVFFIDAANKTRILLRVYGNGIDQIINREHELEWLARLSQLNIGPQLLGIFGNGRFEQYLPSTTLTYNDIRDPETSKQIASCLRELNDIVTVFPYSEKKNSLEVWSDIDKWYKVVLSILPQLLSKSDGWAEVLTTFNLERLSYEIDECKRMLDEIHSPIVFAHNDVSYSKNNL
jgi:thiamine kinase-like enzyme